MTNKKNSETISNFEKLNKGIRIGKAIISVITFIISVVMLAGLIFAFVKLAGGATGAIVKAFIDGIKNRSCIGGNYVF